MTATSIPPVIPVRCKCGKEFRVKAKALGREINCPGCGRRLLITNESEPQTGPHEPELPAWLHEQPSDTSPPDLPSVEVSRKSPKPVVVSRYPNLRSYANAFGRLAMLVLIISVIVGLGFCALGINASSKGAETSVVVAFFIAAMMCVLMGVIVRMILMLIKESIMVGIDIEENTRRSALIAEATR